MRMNEEVQHLELALNPYTPSQVAERVETAGVAKAQMATVPLLTLALLAGAFIAFGGAFFTLAMTGSDLGLGPGRILGGVAFSLGLILVVVGGAELFTGNNLIVMAWADRRVTLAELLRNWGLVYAGNFAGSIAMALMVHWSGTLQLGGGAHRGSENSDSSDGGLFPRRAVQHSGLPCALALFRGPYDHQ